MFDIETLVRTAGYIGVVAIVFAESGLLIGFFLPGDSLLFTAGFLASQGVLHIGILITVVVIAAIAGDSVGYWLGARFGASVFSRKGSRILDPDHIERARAFYALHGAKTIILARFVPIVRTIAPVLAGVGKMPYRIFIRNNVIGGILWGAGITALGYGLGNSIPNVDTYIVPIILLIIVVSVLPGVWHVLKDAPSRASIQRSIKSFFSSAPRG